MRKAVVAAGLVLFCAAAFAQEAGMKALFEKCAPDLKKVCSGSVDELDKAICLSKNLDKLGAACSVEVKASLPCAESTAKLCKDKPKEGIIECLVKKHAELTGACVDRLNVMEPCAIDAENFCKDGDSFDCLLKNKGKASPVCARYLDDRFPCYKEQDKFCKGIKDPQKAYECLRDHYAELSATCVKKQFPCETDLKKLCAGKTDPQTQSACIRDNRKKLTDTCSAALLEEEKRATLMTAYVCADSIKKFCMKEAQTRDDAKISACLEKNAEKLTTQCKVLAVFAPACDAEIEKKCSGLEKTAKIACMKKNESGFSDKCRNALKVLRKDPNWVE